MKPIKHERSEEYRRKASERAKAYYNLNKEKIKEKSKAKNVEYRRNNPDKQKIWKEREKAKSYGLTVEEMRELYMRTNCGICDFKFENTKHKHIDHCHETGKVRGVLCSRCNLALGHMRDSPTLLRKAADYLENDNEPNTQAA